MQPLFKNIRFIVLCISALLSLGIYFFVTTTINSPILQTIRLTQTFALISATYLYLALLAGPFCYTCTWFLWRGIYFKTRRALGVSAFYFGVLHAYFAFFGQLGGFDGLPFLSDKYIQAILLSFSALIILTTLALTSTDWMVQKLTFAKWKLLHRLVYIAGIFILLHALILGTHFSDLTRTVPRISFVLLSFLFLLEALRIDAYIQKKFMTVPRFGITVMIFCAVLFSGTFYFFAPRQGPLSLGIHAQHIQMAKDAQKEVSANPTNPGLEGNKTKRFTVSLKHSEAILPGQDVPLSFKVFNAANGNQVHLFSKIYDKLVHLIIVDEELAYFTHIHPEQNEKEFFITTQFPKAGKYHLYIDFQPLGVIEQQFAFTILVGNGKVEEYQPKQPDVNLTKTFGKYDVTLGFPKPLMASKMTVGEQPFTFTLTDTETKQPVTTLKPYLASFGHLVMIRQQTFEYLHVHPTTQLLKVDNPSGGPSVEFLPLGLYEPIQPGVYRIFAQFNPNNELILADFTVRVE